ncbi:MAG TPA: 5-formyltetrahydrofolate cyclo-ligase [Usitatibacter sp.]|nr:5-formyltetrahydrofolate cyclo-ligase [Usitatibacter sp.]
MSTADVFDLAAWRKAERARLLELRQALPLEQQRADDERILAFVIEGFPLLRGMTIGFYWPFKGEVDPRVIVHRFRTQGARSALPTVVVKAAPLVFREWRPDTRTTPGVFGLPVPMDTEVVVPDAVLVPPVGLDANGYRLGYGGGFFDRTLADISPRPLAIGLGRELSRIETIHPQPYDIPMDFIVTEAGIHETTPAGLRRLAQPRDAAPLAERLVAARFNGNRASLHIPRGE